MRPDFFLFLEKPRNFRILLIFHFAAHNFKNCPPANIPSLWCLCFCVFMWGFKTGPVPAVEELDRDPSLTAAAVLCFAHAAVAAQLLPWAPQWPFKPPK